MISKSMYIAAIDQGTTSTRTIIFDEKLRVVSVAQEPFKQYYPKNGWVEHDAKEIMSTVHSTLLKAIDDAGLDTHALSAIGITNQRETVVAWNKSTGEPLCPAIVWQCRRTANRCEELNDKKDYIQSKTGLLPDPYFSATKIEWMIDNIPKVKIAADTGDLAFGTIDSWIAYNLTRKNVHVTDYSNASRTMLFNINDLEWDEELLDIFNIDRRWLPDVVPTSAVVGYTREGVPVASLVGDQQGALFGQCAFEKGLAKCTYGTGAFLLMNIGEKPFFSNKGLLTTVAWNINSKTHYAMEGSLFMCGAAVDWLKDELKMINSPSETEDFAYEVRDNGGVYFVPALSGLGAPHWDPNARGLFIGMTQSSNRYHMVRSVLESITYGVREIFDTMYEDTAISLKELRIDGGVSKNKFLQNYQSTMLGIPVSKPENVETTAFGAACLAGLAIGIWDSIDDICDCWTADRMVSRKTEKEAEKNYLLWKEAVKRSKNWSL